MKIWSIHPKYLDQKGLTSCWNEALGVKVALENKKNHSQLKRFKVFKSPIAQINAYLYFLLQEAQNRGYNFDSSKINYGLSNAAENMTVSKEEININIKEVMSELKEREPAKFRRLRSIKNFQLHPLFKKIINEKK